MFSLFGLYFTSVTGVLVVATSYALEPVSASLHRRRQFRSYSHLKWVTHEELQLQRLCFEEIGSGDWSSCADPIPVNKTATTLAPLDLGDADHPVLLNQAHSVQGEKSKLRLSSTRSLPSVDIPRNRSQTM